MGISSRILQISLPLNASLLLFISNYFYPRQVQDAANYVFGRFTSDPQLRLYEFGALVVAIAILMAIISIHTVRSEAVNEAG